MLTLPEIKADIERLAARIGAPARNLPTYGRTEDFARPHIEVDGRGYHFVVVERGQEIERRTTNDFDELLYNVFGSATFSIASDYELENRIENQDSRRILFSRQVELLAALSPAWGEREAQRHERILEHYSFEACERRMNRRDSEAPDG